MSFDLFLDQAAEPLGWHYADLGHVISGRLAMRRPVIVEGICLCQVLQLLDVDPDVLVWVENAGGPEHGPDEPTDDYVREFNPQANANHVLSWSQPEPQPA